MFRRSRIAALGLALAFIGARPIVDYHRLDAYFALYASDSSVPWRAAAVRVDTYSGAPIAFAVYQTDPAAVIVAGQNTRPRAIDTRRLRPLASWSFAPPGGYRVQSNEVAVPIGNREGFFVVEARRGNTSEQVWVNRSRIGLVAKELPEAIALYGTDLGTGKALGRMRVSLIINSRFDVRFTDAQGVVRWHGGPRPLFALAQWGSSVAFISFLPQAPVPRAIVAVRTDSAVVHAGGIIHVVGFARARGPSGFHAASGNVTLTLRSGSRSISATATRLDPAGAFTAEMTVPPASTAGDYTLLASAGGSTAATGVHVDADAGGLSLSASAQCEPVCDPNRDVPVAVRAIQNGGPARRVIVSLRVIRAPHLFFGESGEGAWGATQWFETNAQTDDAGKAFVFIPRAMDGLASTFGVRAQAGGATAETRIAVPTAPIAIRLRVDRNTIGTGFPASFTVSVSSAADGKPASPIGVRVELLHGSAIAQQTLQTDQWGQARGAFANPAIGSSLILARADIGGKEAADADQVQVEPQTIQSALGGGNAIVNVAPDRAQYASGQNVRVDARAAGAVGDALLTLECASSIETHVVPLRYDRASASFRVTNAPGMLAVGAVFVRDGALQWSSVPIEVDAPGRSLAASLVLNKRAYSGGAIATATLGGARPGSGTIVVRVTEGLPTGSALFESAPEQLAIGTSATQGSGAAETSWHPWVDSSGNHVPIATFARRSAPPADLAMTQGASAGFYWRVERTELNGVRVPVPQQPGIYRVSVMKVFDDGRAIAASADMLVQ